MIYSLSLSLLSLYSLSPYSLSLTSDLLPYFVFAYMHMHMHMHICHYSRLPFSQSVSSQLLTSSRAPARPDVSSDTLDNLEMLGGSARCAARTVYLQG